MNFYLSIRIKFGVRLSECITFKFAYIFIYQYSSQIQRLFGQVTCVEQCVNNFIDVLMFKNAPNHKFSALFVIDGFEIHIPENSFIKFRFHIVEQFTATVLTLVSWFLALPEFLYLRFFHSFRIFTHDQLVDHVLNFAVHKSRKVINGVVDAMIGNSSLRIVVGAYFRRSVAR